MKKIHCSTSIRIVFCATFEIIDDILTVQKCGALSLAMNSKVTLGQKQKNETLTEEVCKNTCWEKM